MIIHGRNACSQLPIDASVTIAEWSDTDEIYLRCDDNLLVYSTDQGKTWQTDTAFSKTDIKSEYNVILKSPIKEDQEN